MKATTKRSSRPKSAPASAQSKRPASSTADILGKSVRPSAPGKIRPEWTPYYRALLELRDELRAQAGKLAKEATEETPTFSMHMADAGTDSFDRDLALSLLSSDQDALYEVEQAIRRIETGTYGRCELSGKVISKSRLTAIPWARFSTTSQRQLEREGALRRSKLSPLSTLPAAESAEPEEGEDGVAEGGEKE